MRSASRALLAWLAVVAMLFAATGSAFAGHAGSDRECAPAAAEAHDHSAHRIVPEPEPEPEHCASCHLTRSVRVVETGPSLVAATAAACVRPAASGTEPRSADWSSLSSRAPPALLS